MSFGVPGGESDILHGGPGTQQTAWWGWRGGISVKTRARGPGQHCWPLSSLQQRRPQVKTGVQRCPFFSRQMPSMSRTRVRFHTARNLHVTPCSTCHHYSTKIQQNSEEIVSFARKKLTRFVCCSSKIILGFFFLCKGFLKIGRSV